MDIPIKITGLRPGEKLYEELLMDNERNAMTRTAHDKIFVAPPIAIQEDAFERQLVALKKAAEDDDADRVVNLLVDIVGTYAPNREGIAS